MSESSPTPWTDWEQQRAEEKKWLESKRDWSQKKWRNAHAQKYKEWSKAEKLAFLEEQSFTSDGSLSASSVSRRVNCMKHGRTYVSRETRWRKCEPKHGLRRIARRKGLEAHRKLLDQEEEREKKLKEGEADYQAEVKTPTSSDSESSGWWQRHFDSDGMPRGIPLRKQRKPEDDGDKQREAEAATRSKAKRRKPEDDGDKKQIMVRTTVKPEDDGDNSDDKDHKERKDDSDDNKKRKDHKKKRKKHERKRKEGSKKHKKHGKRRYKNHSGMESTESDSGEPQPKRRPLPPLPPHHPNVKSDSASAGKLKCEDPCEDPGSSRTQHTSASAGKIK